MTNWSHFPIPPWHGRNSWCFKKCLKIRKSHSPVHKPNHPKHPLNRALVKLGWPHKSININIYIYLFIYHLSLIIYHLTSITCYRPCLSIIQQLTSNIYHRYMKSFSFYHLKVFIYHHYHLLSIIYQVLAIVTIYHLSLIIITSQVSPKFIPLSSII